MSEHELYHIDDRERKVDFSDTQKNWLMRRKSVPLKR